MSMTEFVLSLDTRLASAQDTAVLLAWRDLRRDLGGAHFGENTVEITFSLEMRPESYTVEVLEDRICIRAADTLGAVYAIYSLSERALGIRPLDYFLGVKREAKCGKLTVGDHWESPAFRVRYRGWFVNDEVLLDGWHTENSGKKALWERIFETLLRCGGNMIIPGTDREYDGRVLSEMALERGLYLTQHHTEVLGARMFGRVYPELQPSYTLYPELFEGLWREAIDRYAGRKVIWAIGFRGQGDRAFWHDDAGFDTDEKRGAFISSVMARQMALVREKDKDAVFSTNLYGEMMDLYRKGYLKIPDEVIRLWGDNGYGEMVSRRQNNLNPRVSAMPGTDERGLHGIYYHVSFYDLQAANHLTMLQIDADQIARTLEDVLDKRGDTLWNINVGSILPHTFFLELVRRLWTDGHTDTAEVYREYAQIYYRRQAVAALLPTYAESAIPYGPHPGDRAGDQFYHFPLRTLARALVRRETEKPLESLLWVAPQANFAGQVQHLAALAKQGEENWGNFVRRYREVQGILDEDAAVRLEETLLLQGSVHLGGSTGLFAFCQACLHTLQGDYLQAFLWTDRALEAHRETLRHLTRVRGRFTHAYDNDCFAGVRQTVQVLESVRAYLRLCGDGDMLYDWEKAYLIPEEETRVVLQTHRTVQLSDDELAQRLRGEVPLLECTPDE